MFIAFTLLLHAFFCRNPIIMSSLLGAQGLVLATAMAVSTTVLYLAFSAQTRIFSSPSPPLSRNPSSQILRSCLSSGGKKKEMKKKNVKFAENVKDPTGNGEEYRKEKKYGGRAEKSCRSELSGIRSKKLPENRTTLYSGILRDRFQHRNECSSC